MTPKASPELLPAIERAEQIANLLESVPRLARDEIAAIESRGPLVVEYNRLNAVDRQGEYGRAVGGLAGVLGRAYADRQNPQTYAEAIRGFCRTLRHYLTQRMTKKAATTPGGLSKAEKALAALVTHPDWSDKDIAKHVGCARTTLYKWPKYVAAREALETGKNHFRRADEL